MQIFFKGNRPYTCLFHSLICFSALKMLEEEFTSTQTYESKHDRHLDS